MANLLEPLEDDHRKRLHTKKLPLATRENFTFEKADRVCKHRGGKATGLASLRA